MATVDQIFAQEGLWEWFNSPVTNPFNGTTEKGQDYSTAWGTAVGAVAPGTVVSVVHNNNAINDVVEVNGPSGLWLYQHINSDVAVGDVIDVGTIVGTENGLPVDQYSTGPHIEVRYAPTYVPGLDSWLQGWINPAGIFGSIGNQDAGNISAAQYASNPSFSYTASASTGGGGGAQPEQTFQKVVLILLALAVMIGGFVMIFHKQIEAGIEDAGKAAVLA